MSARIAFVFLVAFVMFQALTWETEAKTVVRRDAPAASKNASQTIEEAFEGLKTGLDDLLKNIQNNELYQNVSTGLKNFSEKLSTEGQQLVDKIKSSTSTTN